MGNKVNQLLLMTGRDVPFSEARAVIHQPRLQEISLIGEETFHLGSHFLLFDKNKFMPPDKVDLENQSNFDIFMSVINSKAQIKHKNDALMVLTLLFPDAKIKLDKKNIFIELDDFCTSINNKNFSSFQSILSQIFCVKRDVESEFNPADEMAKRIADKIKAKKQKMLETKGKSIENNNIDIYSEQISVLSIGLPADFNTLSNYTVYQLRNAQERYRLKQQFDIYVDIKLAGAEGVEEVPNWMDEKIQL